MRVADNVFVSPVLDVCAQGIYIKLNAECISLLYIYRFCSNYSNRVCVNSDC